MSKTEELVRAELMPPPATFAIRGLSVLAYANGFTLWHYKATNINDAFAPGFFDAASDMLAPGDMLMISSRTGARMATTVATERGFMVVGI